MTPEAFEEIGEDYDDGERSCKTLAALPRSRQALVVTSVSSSSQGPSAGRHMLHAQGTYVTSYFVNTMKRSTHPVVIDLKRILLQLTAYSLRWDVSCLWHDRLEL